MAFRPEQREQYVMVYETYRAELAANGADAGTALHTPSVQATVDVLRETPGWGYRNEFRSRQVRRVEQILSDPATYDPEADPVAIERALAFDWLVYASLTAYEKWLLIEQLARMEDPFGFTEFGLGVGGQGYRDGDVEFAGRCQAFLQGPRAEREALRARVMTRRRQEGPAPTSTDVRPVELSAEVALAA